MGANRPMRLLKSAQNISALCAKDKKRFGKIQGNFKKHNQNLEKAS